MLLVEVDSLFSGSCHHLLWHPVTSHSNCAEVIFPFLKTKLVAAAFWPAGLVKDVDRLIDAWLRVSCRRARVLRVFVVLLQLKESKPLLSTLIVRTLVPELSELNQAKVYSYCVCKCSFRNTESIRIFLVWALSERLWNQRYATWGCRTINLALKEAFTTVLFRNMI